MKTTPMRLSCFSLLLAAGLTSPVFAGDPCMDFKWNVAAERALFSGDAKALAVGASAAAAPLIETSQLYQLALAEQSQVVFAATPGKKMLADGVSAGLVRFKSGIAGAYRVSLSHGIWIDVIASGKAIASSDFGGAPGCERPRKVVLYQLPANTELLLQFSGAADADVRVAITAVPPTP
ncbi:hypothetical protein [uncultured Nevskia sp.]|uniref:hypothetical protein n=1 Tax=uncultured Nevskia sp. TaxID=228950 RepID=UPI0025F8D114|nr:hypothetical protein [uncultured Nevskia sp.]